MALLDLTPFQVKAMLNDMGCDLSASGMMRGGGYKDKHSEALALL